MATFVVLLLILSLPQAIGVGGEKRTFTVPAFNYSKSYRQDVCDRYRSFENGTVAMRDALSGMQLSVLMYSDQCFPYSDETGISIANPGLQAELMDELALRAGFTWRKSFGVMALEDLRSNNKTFTDGLVWGVETYDIYVSWVAQNVDRMNKGVSFMIPWFDSSTVLIDKHTTEANTKIDFFAFLGPFKLNVWLMTALTVLVSGLIHQLIEYLDGERDDRTMGQWFSDNLYLSALSLFQNYEYAPSGIGGRLFGVSMAIWSLIMASTYTANLASMMVADKTPAARVFTMEEAVLLGVPICTKAGVNIDEFVLPQYPNANVHRTETFLECYAALNSGRCKLVADQMDSWFNYEVKEEFNPTCDLDWVGKKVDHAGGGFAAKADACNKCTSFIRDVIDLHMKELIYDGILEILWAKHRAKMNDGICSGKHPSDPDEDKFRRSLRALMEKSQKRRQLKGAATRGEGGVEQEKASGLSLQEMAGTFLLHWVTMAFAVAISAFAPLIKRVKRKRKLVVSDEHPDEQLFGTAEGRRTILQRRTTRRHGPIIGSPPPVNSWLAVRVEEARKKDDDAPNSVPNDAQSTSGLDLNDNSLTSYTMDQVNERPTVSFYKGTLNDRRKRSTFSSQRDDWRRAHEDLTGRMDTMVTLMEELHMDMSRSGHVRPPGFKQSTINVDEGSIAE